MKVTCTYCGKEFEASRGVIAVVKRGDNVYCSDECRIRFSARKLGVTEDVVIEKIKEAGGKVLQADLIKDLGIEIKDRAHAVRVIEFISLLVNSGVIEKEKHSNRVVFLKLRSGEEVSSVSESGDVVVEAKSEVDKASVEDEFEKIAETVESIDIGKRIVALENRVAVLEKKVQILRDVAEKLARAIAGQ